MTPLHIVGMVTTVVLIVGMAIYSGSKAKSESNDGDVGVVTGVIMGTLVGGSSTVGTAQLAYSHGMSAWWFTLGGGIGCLVLGLLYSSRMRAEGVPTIVGILRKEYGERVGLAASILNTIGTFINIIAQLLAASAVVTLVIPALSTNLTIVIAAVLMILYVIFGGTKGVGMVGVLKLCLLYISMAVCGMLALSMCDGPLGIVDLTRGYVQQTAVNYFSVVARGAGKDLGAGFSLVLGVLTTQTYAQGIICGKSDRVAKTGAIISALLVPVMGLFGITVGLYMRSVTDPATFVDKTALTEFVVRNLPSLPAGVVLGTILIASVGTGSGLALGISSILTNDVARKFTHAFDGPKAGGGLSKALIVVVVAGACLVTTSGVGDIIMDFSFMSMAMRGAVIFVPMTFALYAKGRVGWQWALAAILVGPTAVLVGHLAGSPVDPLFVGIGMNYLIMLTGMTFQTRSIHKQINS